MSISQGLYLFVRHAPALISPLCCLMRRVGLTVKPMYVRPGDEKASAVPGQCRRSKFRQSLLTRFPFKSLHGQVLAQRPCDAMPRGALPSRYSPSIHTGREQVSLSLPLSANSGRRTTTSVSIKAYADRLQSLALTLVVGILRSQKIASKESTSQRLQSPASSLPICHFLLMSGLNPMILWYQHPLLHPISQFGLTRLSFFTLEFANDWDRSGYLQLRRLFEFPTQLRKF